MIEQRRGRGPGEGFRQRVPPRPVLVLQRQKRLHRVVPLLWPRPPVRRPAVPEPGLAGLPPLPVARLPLRVRQRHKTILHRYVTDRSRRSTSPGMDVPHPGIGVPLRPKSMFHFGRNTRGSGRARTRGHGARCGPVPGRTRVTAPGRARRKRSGFVRPVIGRRQTARDGGHESGFPVRVEGRRRLRIESPFRSSL